MNETKASRTLVKSPPELWAECSDATSLTRHLDQFGEIKITRLEPETAVAWEGERVCGTVRLEPSGWGTRVTLTAAAVHEPVAVVEPEVVAVVEPEPVAVVDPEPVAVVDPEPLAVVAPTPIAPPAPPPQTSGPAPAISARRPARRGLFGRLLDFLGQPPAEDAPPPVTPPAVVAPPAVATPPMSVAPPAPVIPAAVTPPAPPIAPPMPVVGLTADVPEPPERPAPPERDPDPPERDPDPPERDPDPLAVELANAEAALTAALDSLGQAHHRPFSRV